MTQPHPTSDYPSQCPDLIAIVGMGCRWPGGVKSPLQLWDLLKEKRDGWSEFKEDRINLDGFYHPNGKRPGSMYTRGGHVLDEDTRDFDHGFFGITATEAMALDPSQRKLLEVTYEAVEAAGEPLEKFSGSRTGVFVGNFNNEHQLMQYRDPDHTLPYVVTGGGPTILSNRINYVFNLQGPSLMVDTACSASMYALHLAVTAIRNDDCDAAIVAGANVILGPDNQLFTTKLGAVSPTSRCHTFDAAADGYSRAEGFGAIYLKKLSDAVAAGDPIRAVIRGTSFNANGKTGGISHPSPDGQEAVIRQAYKAAGGLNPDETGYAECHGTGTPVGDPIEVSAIGRVFSPGRQDDPLLIGSIKPNLGHSEAASAMSQIMKAILAMEHGEIPATIGIENFNPSIDFETAKCKVVTEMTPWPADRLRRVSINRHVFLKTFCFGYGGANGHAILDHPSVVIPGYKHHGIPLVSGHAPRALVPAETNGKVNGNNGSLNGNGYANGNGHHANGKIHVNGDPNHHVDLAESLSWCQPAPLAQVKGAGVRSYMLLPISAHDEPALKQSLASTGRLLARYECADVLYTLGTRRSNFARRAYAVVESGSAIVDAINPDMSSKAPSAVAKRIGFVFTGQGAQWPQMGAKLFSEFAVVKQTVQYLDQVLGALTLNPPWTIEGALLEPEATSRIHDPAFSQTVCTGLQIALLALLRQWNIVPAVTVGHSSGEIAAAYAAGHLKACEAIVLAYFRGQVVSMNTKSGLMMAVGLGVSDARSYLDGIEEEVKIAAVNSPNSVTLSGEPDAIQSLNKTLSDKGVFARVLKTGGNAYHSHHMAALGPAYEYLATKALLEIDAFVQQEPALPISEWVSSVTMKKEAVSVDPAYWRRNLESPVLFYNAVERVARESPVDLLVEIGPHPALGGPLKQIRTNLEANGSSLPTCLGTLARGEDDVVSMLSLAGNLFINNAEVNLVAVNATEKVKQGKLELSHGFFCLDMAPYKYSYPEKPMHYENRFNKEYRLRKHLRHDILGARVPGGSRNHPQWRNILRQKDLPWLEDHKLLPHVVLPGAAYMAMAIEAATQLHHEAEDAAPIKSFKLRQVAINSALRVEDTELGVETLLNMERLPLTNAAAMSQWYKFSIGSILPNSDVWTQHCTGTICVTTTETVIEESNKLQIDHRSKSLDISAWHKRFHTAGLGYGPAFQGLSDLKAYRGANVASANVSLSPTRSFENESQYVIHPATLDTCIQLALISCHAGQVEHFKKAFVPIFADEVLVWLPDSAEEQAVGVASGDVVGLRSVYAKVQLYNSAGAPLLDIGELKCVSYEGIEDTSATQTTRELYWRPVARPDVDTLTPSIAKAMFPPKEIAGYISTNDALERLSVHVLVGIAEKLQTVSLTESVGENHGQFSDWVKNWAASTKHQASIAFGNEDGDAEIQKLANELDSVPEAKCLVALHNNFDKVLSGETNSVKVLMENGLLANLYASGIFVQGAHVQFQKILDLLAHKNPRMRVMEVGAGSAGATLAALETLRHSPSKRFQEYVVTDSQGWCVADAKSRIDDHGHIVFETLDIMQDPLAQSFKAASFDLVIAAGSLTQFESPETALRNMRLLLKPSGSLVLVETTHLTLASEVLFRTLTGQWGREHVSVDEKSWDAALKKSGFSGVDISLKDYSGDQQQTTVMLSKAIHSSTTQVVQEKKRAEVFLVYSHTAPLAADVTFDLLHHQGFNPVLVDLFSVQDIAPKSPIISFVDTNGGTFTCRDETYFEAVRQVIVLASSLVWLGADLMIPGESSVMKGFLRSIATENVQSRYAFVELDHTDYTRPSRVAELLVHKLTELEEAVVSLDGVDRECVLSGGSFYIERLLADADLNQQFSLRNTEEKVAQASLGSQGPIKARYRQPGVLSSLYFSSDPDFDEPLRDDWVEIRTEAIGLNIKDLAVATARFDLDKLSTEGAGVVKRVGSAVQTLQEGDRVFGIIPGNMGNHLRSPASLVAKIPSTISSPGAASMPVAYLTSIYAFQHLARLGKGESVLIQSATGGLGMAAIRIAQHIGAEIYATVGTDDKRHVLTEEFGIPANRIFNSRKLSAVDDVMRATGQKGIDVILCSSAGDLMHETWRLVAPLGRFVDVGRTDVLGGGRLEMEVFKRNATFSSFDLGLVYRQKPSLIKRLMDEMMHLVDQGVVGPIQHLSSFCISQLEPAMSNFSKGVHTGKFVITFDDPAARLKVARSAVRAKFDPAAAYLLVGGLGGLGRSLAMWMVERGARHLVFLSRSGADRPEAVALVKDLEAVGASPKVVCCDVTCKAAVASAVSDISARYQVKGVIHAAMVEGDALFSNATWPQIQNVLRPKVTGTVNLHHATEKLPLDFFLMTSSIVGTVGTPSQGAYTAANAFQDAFARFRRSQSLPATALGLGLILEVGSVSGSLAFQQMLQRNATYGSSETEFLQFIEGALCDDDSDSSLLESDNSSLLSKADPTCMGQIVTGLEPGRFLSYLDNGRVNDLVWYNNPRFQAVAQAISDQAQQALSHGGSGAGAHGKGSSSSVSVQLKNASTPAEKLAIARSAVTTKIAELIGVAADEIDADKPVSRYGVDSLVAGELRNWLIRTFGIDISMLQLLNKNTKIEALVQEAVKTS
ncbi:Beta-ketoacyl synthase [Beauveria brongniartii RCEF 3172]|uniref:Beta-ketoacyl synthase n=1 Tax=Beauveria brongniartii RCEF 3172 TaxID=1081107 RepID=A0A167BIY4_9HYPO|nr:Beta-ketoacyl synthase [Beauveria brongniartii RCEF 3172]